MELKPEKIWKLFEVEGFQILVQLDYKEDGEEDRHYVIISSPMNGVMVSMAIGFKREAAAQEVFDKTEAEGALKALKQVIPEGMIQNA